MVIIGGVAIDHVKRRNSPIRCAILTVSDTRTSATDSSGASIADLLSAAGHQIGDRRLVPDDPALVAPIVRAWAAGGHVDVILTTGGTGIARRDSTFEALQDLLDKELPGFGELFRMLSFGDIGPAAMLTRATAGTMARTAIFMLPGSEHAVRLGMTRLILPQLEHVVSELSR